MSALLPQNLACLVSGVKTHKARARLCNNNKEGLPLSLQQSSSCCLVEFHHKGGFPVFTYKNILDKKLQVM